LAWMAGRHDEAEVLAASAWEDGGAIERAAAAAMLAPLRVLRNDNAGAGRWAGLALHGGGPPARVASDLRAIRAVGLALSGHPAEGLRLLDDLPQDPTASQAAHLGGVIAGGLLRMLTDALAGARADLQVCIPGRSGWQLSPHALTGLACLADVEYRIGAWDDSIGHAEQAISLVIDTDQVWLLAFAHAMGVLVPAARGIWDQAHAHAQAAARAAQTLNDEASLAYAANAAVHLAACRGDPTAVIAAAEPLRAYPPDTAPHEPGVFGWAGQHAAALVALGRFEDAESALDRLGAIGEQRGRRSTLATVARVRGELATARHEPAAARRAFEEALRAGAGSAAALDQAVTHAAYGRLLRRAGERRAAGDQLHAAQETFERLGAQPFLERCNTELAACGLAVDRVAGPVGSGLTAQERAVARLVCAGASNREVAAELVISVKTVGYHLGNAYTKLGVNSRTQLAALLGQPGR
jgi:ATP/maltotriose-dependent transcriptional regulator MalT